ncbi:MAG TPA: hypothetical protein VFT46_04080 [Holophagaceae bacterium]|nr:hypothetical protein [Holophagaceae bacterium]
MPFLLMPPALVSPGQAKAKPKPAAKVKWDGEWSLSVPDSDAIKDRIASFVQGMNILQRTLWKKRLTNACLPYDHLSVLGGAGYSLTFGKEVPINLDLNATAVAWTRRDDEEKFQASLKQNAPNSLTLVLQGDGYTLTDALELDGDTLTIRTTYSHPKLDQAFDYTQVYKRDE